MNNSLKLVLAALLAAGAMVVQQPAQAQIVGDQNTTVTGAPIFVEEENADVFIAGHNGLNINGAVGLPINPTANTPAKGSVRVQGNYYRLWDDAAGDSKLFGVYAAGGVTDRLEVSAGIEKNDANGNSAIEDALDKTGIALGVKYLVKQQQSPSDVRIAIGAGYSRALYRNTNIYAVASKSFGEGNRLITGHLGIRYDRFKVDATPFSSSETSSRLSAFVGAEVPLDRAGRFSLVGEVGTKNADEDLGGAMPYSVSLRFQNRNGLAASLGLMRQGVLSDFVDDDTGLFAQIGKTF